MRRITNVFWLIGLVWLLLIAATWRSGSDLAEDAAVPALSDNGYQIDGGRYVRLGALYWNEATGHLLLCSEGASDCPPGAPATPEPTATPSTTPTQPGLTLTPSPPSTPQAPTPTPEGPTATPGPPPTQITPDPKPAACEGVVINQTGLNVRATPSVNAPVIATLSPDEVAIIDAFYIVQDGREEWAHITRPIVGWVAAWYYTPPRRLLWWPEDLSDGERAIWCLPPYVEVEWASNPPPSTPPPLTRNPRGLHLIYSARPDPVQAALPGLGTIKATDGAEWALSIAKQYNPDIVTVYRVLYTPWGKLDCPPDWGHGDPVQAANAWYDMLVGVWGTRGLLGQIDTQAGPVRVVDYFEYRNECGFVGSWEVAFDIQMLRRATAGGICLLAFSDAYGTPELHEFAQRKPVLDEMLEHPCRAGMWHGIALHGYSKHDSGPWLFGRWRLFREVVGDAYDALGYWFTEWGVPNTAGSYDGRGEPDCAAMEAELAMVDQILRSDAGVGGYHVYSVGGGSEWIDITPCL